MLVIHWVTGNFYNAYGGNYDGWSHYRWYRWRKTAWWRYASQVIGETVLQVVKCHSAGGAWDDRIVAAGSGKTPNRRWCIAGGEGKTVSQVMGEDASQVMGGETVMQGVGKTALQVVTAL